MYVQNVCLWLKQKLASVLAIGQLHHQSATALRCTTQLQDVRSLPLFVRWSKPVSCTFLTQFLYFPLFPVLIRKFPNQSLSTRSLLIPISFNYNCVFFTIIFTYLPVIYLSLHDSDVMFMSQIKLVAVSYTHLTLPTILRV